MAKFSKSHRKEKYFSNQYTLFDTSENYVDEVVTIRVYRTKNNVYVVVWVPKLDLIASASSCHMYSAIGSALENLELPYFNKNLHYYDNMREIAKNLYPNSKSFFIHQAHA